MISLHSDRISFNRPGYSPNVLVTNMHSFLKGATLQPNLNNVSSAIQSGAANFDKMLKMQHPTIQCFEHYRHNYTPGVAKAANSLLKAMRTEKKRIDEVFENGLKPLAPIDPARAILMLQMLSGRKPGEIIKLCLVNRDIAALVLEDANWKLLDMPEAGLEELRNNIWRINTERAFNVTEATMPTLQDILGEHPSQRVASDRTAAAIAEIEDARSDLKSAVNWFRSAISFTAALSETSPEDVFNLVRQAA